MAAVDRNVDAGAQRKEVGDGIFEMLDTDACILVVENHALALHWIDNGEIMVHLRISAAGPHEVVGRPKEASIHGGAGALE